MFDVRNMEDQVNSEWMVKHEFGSHGVQDICDGKRTNKAESQLLILYRQGRGRPNLLDDLEGA